MRHYKALPLTTDTCPTTLTQIGGKKERKNTALMHECAYSINEPLVIGSVLKEDFEEEKKPCTEKKV